MKGTISPELKMIMTNPDYRIAFMKGYLNRESPIHLGDGKLAFVNYGGNPKGFDPSAHRKNKRNLLQILLGR